MQREKIYCYRTCTRTKNHGSGKFTFIKGYWYSIDYMGDNYVNLIAGVNGAVRFWLKSPSTRFLLSNYFYTSIKDFRKAKLEKLET